MLRQRVLIAISLLVLSLPVQSRADSQTRIKDSAVKFTSDSEVWGGSVKKIAPQFIGKDKILLAVGGTLYMLNEKQQIRWKYDVGADINGFIYVPRFGSVYVIAMDLTWDAVSVETGKKRWSIGSNGRATYSQIQNYGKDKYVVVTDMTGYDSGFNECYDLNEQSVTKKECLRTEPDYVELMQDRKLVGEAEFPSNAQLAVVGSHVWAITTGKTSTEVREIHFSKPEERLKREEEYLKRLTKQLTSDKTEGTDSEKCE